VKPEIDSILARRQVMVNGSSPPRRQMIGWVTLRKNGRNLVTSRIRQLAWSRQQASLLWKLQQLNDRLQLSLQTEAAMLDPTGVGFAFGGVLPGHLHAKGQLHEWHKVFFSIDCVGCYLLHVRLRQQARPVPGSPFALTVIPAAAHHSTTYLNPVEQPLTGEVGSSPSDGCMVAVHACDRVGNLCTRGEGNVQAACATPAVTSSCVDQGDGSYTLQWQGKVSGVFDASLKINGQHVRGSPMKILLVSTRVHIPATVIEGAGLREAIAGEQASIKLKVFDEFGNPSNPGPRWQVGVSISSLKKKLAELPPHPNFSGTWGPPNSGEFFLTYSAETAGYTELYLWVLDDTSNTRTRAREALPGTPVTLHVTAGPPDALNSYCDSWTLAESKNKAATASSKKATAQKDKVEEQVSDGAASTITAGDVVSVRANGVDQFGNAALMNEAQLSAKIRMPNGHDQVIELVKKGVGNRAQGDAANAGMSTMYELRHETSSSGPHQMHVLLNGEPIKASPVEFEVLPAAPTPNMSELIPPVEVDNLLADLEKPTTIVLRTCDKFGNECQTGGLRIAGRLQLVKLSSSDNSILMPNNHSVTIEDKENGFYEVHVAVMISANVKLVVNMDKDLPGITGELPPLQLTFVKDNLSAASAPVAAAGGEPAAAEAMRLCAE